MSLPRAIDDLLTPRVPCRTAAKYLGVSPRQVQRLIASGRLRAIDVAAPGAGRPTWAIRVDDLRAFILAAEFQAERRLEALRAPGSCDEAAKKRQERQPADPIAPDRSRLCKAALQED